MPPPRPQPVDTQPAGDHHQPGLGIVDGGDVGAGQAGERLLHHVLGVAQVEQDAERDVEHPAPVGLPQRVDDRVVAPGWRGSAVGIVVPMVAVRRTDSSRGHHAFFRMPSCQISFSIDGLALRCRDRDRRAHVGVVERLAQQAVGQIDPGGEPVADVVDLDAVLRDSRRFEEPRRADDRPGEVAARHDRFHPAHVVVEGLAQLVDDVGLQDLLEDEPAERLGVGADRARADDRQPFDARRRACRRRCW